MTALLDSAGESVNYTAGATISSGDVLVLGTNSTLIMGVALEDIANGSIGAVAIEGVYNLPKVSAAVIVQGESVIWDSSASEFDDNQATPASGDISACCVAVESAGNGVTTVAVKLNVGIGTKT